MSKYPHSYEVSHNAFGADFLIGFDYRITSNGAPATRDDPAEGMEYEIDPESITIRKDGADTVHAQPLELPAWLAVTLAEWIYEDSDGSVYDAISCADDGPDPDAMRDAMMED